MASCAWTYGSSLSPDNGDGPPEPDCVGLAFVVREIILRVDAPQAAGITTGRGQRRSRYLADESQVLAVCYVL